ncbi:SubName: Full=Related to ZAP1-metalloregulatory protein involved in zinc-responsive transcriptional regulation {ECO:0000313/EMBL:CCA72908.1} [Serendipita indica DSM 11827]|uniref:Related to ZAP1-metalloregulatory protein involved in zinc-responsive transcriptional regulation n=1 Tax=Serendipita indica (strain DSM 11827) TaxID=1109443 RepID=G4TNL5_SERID|nr:SubName: Full=Related to ZAP1-metalloregulatory protein involved in zinc-responsive transcriptional regulation {ECO:0000313/EMBL:CCA72908.1} [Serendipita indica DSM 11827]CCA72908.1 related to ZAP1-metalloregulatory protein involved in zinc-responsive transcriptional regulation [Serendipita indica DSM 11827]
MSANMHLDSEMARHQQFLSQLGASDGGLFGIDPTLLPDHLGAYHDDDNAGDGDEGEEHDGQDVGDAEQLDHEDHDVPTPPFYNGEIPEPSARPRAGTLKSPTSMQGPSLANGQGVSAGSSASAGGAGGQRISRLPDPRAQALMQLVPMPSQLPPGAQHDPNGQQMNDLGGMHNYDDPRYNTPTGGAQPGMLPHPAMLMAPGLAPVGLSTANPADQVGTWTESVNAYWQPMGLPAFQAPVLVSGGLAATIRDARIAWMVGESVCGHPSCLGRRFERKTNLLKHLLTHVEARPYVCPVQGCDQAFKQKWLLDRHGRVHSTNKEVHKCPVPGCTTTCSSLYNLRNHELVHSETKKFLCEFENCGRTFATARNLRLHQRTHTGDKPFACDYPGCGMRYHRPAHLKRHQEIHSDNPKPKARKRKDGTSTTTGRRNRRTNSELDNEIDELAGDADAYMARLNAAGSANGDEEAGVRARPRRSAAVAAMQANRSKKYQDVDFGDDGEEEEEEDDEDDEDEVGPDGDAGMDEDDEEDDEEEDADGYRGYAKRSGFTPGRKGAPAGPTMGGVPAIAYPMPGYGQHA